jgi:hypothetical protein
MSLVLEVRNVKFVRLVTVKLSLLDSLRGNVAINNLGDSFAHILNGKFREATSTSISNLPATMDLPLWQDRWIHFGP